MGGGAGSLKTKPVAKIIASTRSVSRQETGGDIEMADWDEKTDEIQICDTLCLSGTSSPR